MHLGQSSKAVALAVLLVCVFGLSGCALADDGARLADDGARLADDAARLTSKIEQLAARTGSSTDDISTALQRRFPTLSSGGLADEADEILVNTAWMDDAIARLKSAQTNRAVYRSTCDWIGRWDFVKDLSEVQRAEEFRLVIVARLQEEQLSEDAQSIQAVWEAVSTQLESLASTGALDPSGLSTDLFCALNT